MGGIAIYIPIAGISSTLLQITVKSLSKVERAVGSVTCAVTTGHAVHHVPPIRLIHRQRSGQIVKS